MANKHSLHCFVGKGYLSCITAQNVRTSYNLPQNYNLKITLPCDPFEGV